MYHRQSAWIDLGVLSTKDFFFHVKHTCFYKILFLRELCCVFQVSTGFSVS